MDILRGLLLFAACLFAAYKVIKWLWPIIEQRKDLTAIEMVERAIMAPGDEMEREATAFGSIPQDPSGRPGQFRPGVCLGRPQHALSLGILVRGRVSVHRPCCHRCDAHPDHSGTGQPEIPSTGVAAHVLCVVLADIPCLRPQVGVSQTIREQGDEYR